MFHKNLTEFCKNLMKFSKSLKNGSKKFSIFCKILAEICKNVTKIENFAISLQNPVRILRKRKKNWNFGHRLMVRPKNQNLVRFLQNFLRFLQKVLRKDKIRHQNLVEIFHKNLTEIFKILTKFWKFFEFEARL